MKIKTISSYKPQPGRKTTMPSMTKPDDAMSIPEMLMRFSKGMPLNIQERVPVYNGDEQYYPNMADMDLADQEAFIAAAKKDYEDKLSQFKKQQQEERSKKAEEYRKQKKVAEDQATELEFYRKHYAQNNILKKPGVAGAEPPFPSTPE